MFKQKYYFLLLLFFLFSRLNFAQSFTYSGPTTVTVPYGSSTATASYTFNYSGLAGLCYPGLIISVDGTVINNDLCHNPSTPGSYGISLTPGNHTIKFSLLSVDCNTLNCYHAIIHQTKEFTVTCKFNISVENIFGGGSIYADGTRTSPFHRPSVSDDNVSLGAIEQNYGNYNWVWSTSGNYPSEWRRVTSTSGSNGFSNSQNTFYSIQSNDINTRLVAGLRKVCGLTFQANGSMYINGNNRTSPYIESVVEQNSISATASSYTNNGIDFTFSKWSSSGVDYYSPVIATEHKTYTAVYTGKPSKYSCSISFNVDQENQPIQITWTKHPLDNSSVTHYAVWRQVTKFGTPTLLTTVSATGASSYNYIDYDYTICSGDNKILLFYDIRAYYSPSDAYSDIDFYSVYGFINQNQQPDEIIQNQISFELPATLSISNYPNPYNPTTTISYQLPENSFVSIKVFDILGKEVAELVNESKPAGYYTINFDGSRLTSGVYIYTITANGIVQSKKMLLAK